MARDIRTRVRLVNCVDEVLSQRGVIRPEEVRSLELRDSIFDTVVEDQDEPLIGMEILEALDLWPDPQRGVLTTNPLSTDIPLYNLL